jgi:hypothetical protein
VDKLKKVIPDLKAIEQLNDRSKGFSWVFKSTAFQASSLK